MPDKKKAPGKAAKKARPQKKGVGKSRAPRPDLLAFANQWDEKQKGAAASIQTLQAHLPSGFQIISLPNVVWLARARTRIRRKDLIPSWNQELEAVFAKQSPIQITVSDVFHGYNIDEGHKLVLGVQIAFAAAALGSHIVKLGGAKVKKDYDGWKCCILERGIASRMLIQVQGHALPDARYAVIYQDAYQFFGSDPEVESPKPFEVAADWSITDSKPDVISAERVLAQIFRELDRCLYRDARVDEGETARNFYATQLGAGGDDPVKDRWQTGAHYRDIRRDALWLTTALAKPDAISLPGYLDPYDFVVWSLEHNQVPSTLIGSAHGDLHGRNVLVGVSGGEIEHPVIFDHGEMSDNNPPVWDFVKFETELKTAILPKLFSDPAARKALASAGPRLRPSATAEPHRLEPDKQAVAERVDRLEFACHFETLLSRLTSQIISEDIAERSRPQAIRELTGHVAIDKALCFFYKLRQQAAWVLGYATNRNDDWRDEFYFALAVYGLLKAKWNLDPSRLEWSLMSAGVAVTQIRVARETIQSQRADFSSLNEGAPSHLPVLKRAHELWKNRDSGKACKLLSKALSLFPLAVSLKAEYALCLAAIGKLDDARAQVEQLRPLCAIFRDHEMLSRLGRILKDDGDARWASSPADFANFVKGAHPAWQRFKDAFAIYREAFDFSRDYFPGINAATLALLTGQIDEQRAIAQEVLKICRETSTANDQFWIYATEGEASLICGENADALTLMA